MVQIKDMGSKYLSQHETESSFSSEPNMKNEKKNKKDKSKKKKLLSTTDTQLNESYVEISSGKKKKHKKKNRTSVASQLDLDQSFEEFVDTSGGKKKKHKKKNRTSAASQLDLDQSFEEFVDTSGEKSKKKKSKKKETTSDSLNVNENNESFDIQETPKKKQKKRSSKETSEIVEMQESSFFENSPEKKKKKKDKKIDLDSDLTSKYLKSIEELDTQTDGVSPHSHKKRKQEDIDVSTESHKKKRENSLTVDSIENIENIKSGSKANQTEKKKIKNDQVSNINGKLEDKETSKIAWTSDEVLCLIKKVKDSLDSEDTASYQKTIPAINWEDITFDDRSANDCKNMVLEAIKKLTKFKSLTMLLNEAEINFKKPSNVTTAKDRFVREFFRNKKREPNYSYIHNKDILVEANAAWMALPTDEREKYEAEYKDDIARRRILLDLPPEPPRFPVTIYNDILAQKMGDKAKRTSTKEFHKLAFEDKIPYIHESFKECAQYIEEIKAYKNNHPDWKITKSRIANSLFQEYLDYLGMPKYKNNAYVVFAADVKDQGKLDSIAPKDRFKHLSDMYKKLSQEKKLKLSTRAKEIQHYYLENYNTWLESQDEAVAVVADTYFKPKTIIGKPSHAFRNTVEMSIAKPRFKDEPDKPPTAIKLFSNKFERRTRDKYNSKEEMRSDCLAAWKHLPEESKAQYKKKEKIMKETYKESLLEFVRGLGQGSNMYLGYKRLEFYKYFKEDIFEHEFSNDQYPVYVSPTKKEKLLTHDKYSDDTVQSDLKINKKCSKDEEHSSENSSDNEDAYSSKSKKKGSLKNLRASGSKSRTSVENYSEDEDDDDDQDFPAKHTSKVSSASSKDDDDSEDDEKENESDESEEEGLNVDEDEEEEEDDD